MFLASGSSPLTPGKDNYTYSVGAWVESRLGSDAVMRKIMTGPNEYRKSAVRIHSVTHLPRFMC